MRCHPIKISCTRYHLPTPLTPQSQASTFRHPPRRPAAMVIASPLNPCAPCGPFAATSAPELQPAAPTRMAPCSVANNALQEGHAAPLHFFFLLHLSPKPRSSKTHTSQIRRLATTPPAPLSQKRTTSLTPLISTHSPLVFRGSPVLTQISARIDPGYTGFNGATKCSGAAISGWDAIG